MPIISGILRHLDGSAWVGADLLFQLLQPSYTASTQFPVDTKAATTIAGGAFSVSLWDNGAGVLPSYIRCTINGGDRLEFVIPPGSGNASLVSLLNPVGTGTQGTRVVTGHFEYLDQTPRAGEKVRIGMDTPSYTSAAIYPSDRLDLTLDSNGDFSQAVWANGGGSISAPIKFEGPTGEVLSVSIPAGSGAITLSALRALAPVPPTPSAPPVYPAPSTVPLSAVQGVVDSAIVSARDFVAAAMANSATGGVYEGSTDFSQPGGVLTQTRTYDRPAGPGRVLLLTKDFTYSGGVVSQILYTNNRTNATMTQSFTYSSGAVANISKVVA